MTAAARSGSAGWLAAERRPTVVLLAFLVAIALLGGASRADVQSLVVMRPLAVLALGFAVWRLPLPDLRTARVPLALLLALIVWCALQLVPLPPHWWSALSGRGMFAAVYDRLSVTRPWHPISLYPALTLNSLLALLVPLAALLLAAGQPGDQRPLLLKALILTGVMSALLGLFQILGPAGGPLYLYRVTNITSPVGLFSNRNHQAVFLAALIPLMSCYLLLPRPKGANQTLRLAACIGVAVFLLPLLIATGSRAGAIAMVLSVVLTAWLLPPVTSRSVPIGPLRVDTRLLAVIVVIMLVAALWFSSARTETFSRLAEQSLSNDLRFQTAGTSQQMIERFFPWGSGFGTFADVYQIFEPTHLMSESYLNHAHNDLLEVLLEGGLPAAALLLITIGLLVVRVWRVVRLPLTAGQGGIYERTAAIVLTLFLFASVFDYPARVPLIASLCAIMTIWLWQPAPASRLTSSRSKRR